MGNPHNRNKLFQALKTNFGIQTWKEPSTLQANSRIGHWGHLRKFVVGLGAAFLVLVVSASTALLNFSDFPSQIRNAWASILQINLLMVSASLTIAFALVIFILWLLELSSLQIAIKYDVKLAFKTIITWIAVFSFLGFVVASLVPLLALNTSRPITNFDPAQLQSLPFTMSSAGAEVGYITGLIVGIFELCASMSNFVYRRLLAPLLMLLTFWTLTVNLQIGPRVVFEMLTDGKTKHENACKALQLDPSNLPADIEKPSVQDCIETIATGATATKILIFALLLAFIYFLIADICNTIKLTETNQDDSTPLAQ